MGDCMETSHYGEQYQAEACSLVLIQALLEQSET